jgi:hypothetical protein
MGGIIVYDVWTVVKVAFGGATAVTVGDCGAAEGWLEDTDATIGTTGRAGTQPSSAFDSAGYVLSGRPQIYNTTDADHVKLVFTGDATAGILDVYVVWAYADFDALANTDWPNT